MYLHDLTSIKIDLTKQEVEDIAFDTKRVLLASAANHWFNHYKCDHLSEKRMRENEFAEYVLFQDKERYARLSFLFGLVGLSNVTKNLEEELKEIYRKKVEDKNKSK